MLHIAKSLLPIKQLIVLERPEDDKFSKKLDNYIYKEGSFFRHYSHILNSSFTKLNTRVNHNNNHYDIINTIIDISDIFDIKYNDDIYKSYNSEEIIEITNQYIKEHISLPDKYSDFIGIEKDIKQYNESFQHDEEYSFYKGTKIFLETNITPQDAKISIIRMLFARDLFNFDAITLLREYLINSPMANTTLQIDTSNKNKCDNLLAFFRSDYKLLKEILYIFDESNNINIKQLFLYEPSLVINGALNTILFDYICALIYSRYIIAIYIFLIEDTHSDFMNDKNIEYSLIKIYRRLGLLILSSVYKDISVSDLIWFQQLMIINDILIHSYFIIQNKRIFELESVLSTLSTYYTPKYTCKISVTIDNIIKDAIKMYKDGSEHSHIQMIEYFKKKKKYADYFSIRGFERNLKSKLKRVMKDNNINKIEGDGYYRKGYKRPRKKKEES